MRFAQAPDLQTNDVNLDIQYADLQDVQVSAPTLQTTRIQVPQLETQQVQDVNVNRNVQGTADVNVQFASNSNIDYTNDQINAGVADL